MLSHARTEADRLLADAKSQADRMVAEARAHCDHMVAEARDEASPHRRDRQARVRGHDDPGQERGGPA